MSIMNLLREKVSGNTQDLLKLTLTATTAASLLYFCFFLFAPWIWSQNIPYKPEEITPWMHYWLSDEKFRDGYERYVLYFMMFLDLLVVYAMIYVLDRHRGKTLAYLSYLVLAIASAFLLHAVGFYPPMSTFSSQPLPHILADSARSMAIILPITAILYYVQKRSFRWLLILVAYLLVPVCFISTAPLSQYDTPYIFDPALRLLHGAALPDIYFQYDLFPSMIALAWLKLHLPLNLFQMVAEFSYYLLLLALLYFSRQWFADKRLPVFMLVAMIVVRIYAGPYDASNIFQVTPLRLDMWFILLLLVFYKGPHHWSAGLYCGLMLLLHKNFGIIYSAAYVQLLLTLCVLEKDAFAGGPIRAMSSMIRNFFRKSRLNLVLMLAGILSHILLFWTASGHDDFYYQQLGIGFTRIADNSFYWYVLIVTGLSFVLLLRLRERVSANYFAAGLCLIFLLIGNSIYFFGRSHENNLINISLILMLLFFLLLDLCGLLLAQSSDTSHEGYVRKHLPALLSVVLIAALSIWYGDSIVKKGSLQVASAARGQFNYPQAQEERDIQLLLREFKPVLGDSRKVYFVSGYDFLFYYYGGYAPVGYYSPMESAISQHEFDRFLQDLVNRGYYLVVDDRATDALHLPSVPFYVRRIRSFSIIWKV